MRRFTTLAGGIAYLTGTPILLVALGLGPDDLVRRFLGMGILLVAREAVTIALAGGVWLLWVGSLASVAIQIRRLRRSGRGIPIAEPRVRLAATFAVAVWSLLGGGREAPVPLGSEAVVTSTVRDEAAARATVAAMVTPALAAAVLEQCRRRRSRAMCTASRGERLAPYSRTSLALLDRLTRLAAEPDRADEPGEPRSGTSVSVDRVHPKDAMAIESLVEESGRLYAPEIEVASTDAGDWQVMVRVLGPVEAETRSGAPVEFRKSRSLELLAWLVCHRERPTRSAARTAIWDTDVQDATFHNVVSETRRALSSAGLPEDSIGRPSPSRFVVHGGIVSDAELLERAYLAARHDAADTPALERALGLVRDLPFAGTGFRWPDTEGITSNMVMLVVDAAVLLAERALGQGDVAGVFRATGRGLRVLAGHEELVSLRMRAHAAASDFAAVEEEWRRYERTTRLDDDVMDVSKVRRLREDLLGRVR